MACRSCAERRRILAEAKARDGIKGVVKAIPQRAERASRSLLTLRLAGQERN